MISKKKKLLKEERYKKSEGIWKETHGEIYGLTSNRIPKTLLGNLAEFPGGTAREISRKSTTNTLEKSSLGMPTDFVKKYQEITGLNSRKKMDESHRIVTLWNLRNLIERILEESL